MGGVLQVWREARQHPRDPRTGLQQEVEVDMQNDGKKKWRSFEEAREYTRGLGLRKKSGPAPREWRPFEEARAFVHGLNLTRTREWREWSKSGQRPIDIPGNPNMAYKNDGWAGYSDWLGIDRTWRSFEEARAYARSLSLTTNVQWKEWAKTERRPNDIPASPNTRYKDQWRGWGDWLGTGNKLSGEWRNFIEARDFARSLNLKNARGWEQFSKSGQRPNGIPGIPYRIYKNEWQGWGDWLGTGKVWNQGRIFKPFKEAREFARSLGLDGQQAWLEYCASGQRPDDIPSNPQQVYKDEWRGVSDWLGIVNRWKRGTLLAFLEALRPHLHRLEEKELYAIIAQSGAMPGLVRAFGKDKPDKLIQDFKENEGRGVEEAIGGASEEELEEAEVSGIEHNIEAIGAVDDENTPPEEYLAQKEQSHIEHKNGGLPSLITREGLRAIDDLAELHYGLDDEVAEYLVGNRVAALWTAHINNKPVDELLAGEGGHYFGLIRSRFYGELEAVENLPVPAGWAFRPDGKKAQPPVPPNMMQKRTAYEVLTKKRVGNWSGVGTGKTISGILASRIANRRHTLVITNKATIKGWAKEIENAFPDSVVHTELDKLPESLEGGHHYTLINYDRFQLPNRRQLVRNLADAGVDFVIFDEVQLVKQRDKSASLRREAVEGLLSLLTEHVGDDLHVLAMSATPVINNLLEARKLLEVVMGRSFAELNTQATVANALAIHRVLMVYGLRYKPDRRMAMDLKPVQIVRNDLLDDLRAADGVLALEQALLPAELEAIRSYIRPGVMIYTHYVDGMVEPIRRFVEKLGYSVGLYTGFDKSGLESFKAGHVDMLIGSEPVGTGLDGLQKVCDRLIMMCLPWTSALQEQIEGRIKRQGSNFSRVSVVVPAVVLDHNGDQWSWDRRRAATIEYKRTLSDCAVDGSIPEAARMSPERLLNKSRIALEEWVKRIQESDELFFAEMRPELRVPLPPEIVKRLVVKRGDFSVLNNRWSTSNSQTVHERLKAEPEEWYLYHTLYREARANWPEVPAERIAERLKSRPDLCIGDFGCGEGLLKQALGSDHDVVQFDHVAVSDDVIACDIAHTPLEKGSLGAAVFSLSLMGRNWRDYLAEAHRTLQPYGLLFIAEPARRWETGALEKAVEEAGFDLIGSAEQRGNFFYLRAVKS